MGIRKKLLGCMVAAMLPLLAVSVFAMHMLEKQISETTVHTLRNTHQLEAARINQILEDYANDAQSLAAGPHVKNFVAEVNSHRNSNYRDVLSDDKLEPKIIGGYDEFAIIDPESDWPLQQLALKLQKKAGMVGSSMIELKLLDRQGNTLGESIGFTWQPVNSNLMDHSMSTVETLFGDAFRDAENRDKLGVVTPISDNNNNVVGALLIEFQLEQIVSQVTSHEGIGESSEAHIAQPTASGDAQFITSLRFDKQAAFNKIVPNSQSLPVNQSLTSPKIQVLRAKDYRTEDSFLAIQTIPLTGWGLIVKVDAKEALAPLSSLKKSIFIVTSIAAALILFIYVVWLMPCANRLNRTAAAAIKIKNGDLTARIKDGHKDEISEVASSINSLAYDLELDQKKRSQIEARLRHQALHDDLTGLLNRKHANLLFEKLHSDKKHSHTVLFLDLNGFKSVNDIHGHAVGDEVLKGVADVLANEIPEGATLARWGGDEFVVISPDTDELQGEELALAFHQSLEDPITSSKGSHQISCSIGYATTDGQKSLENLLIEADTKMYEQKNQQNREQSKSDMLKRGVERALNEKRLELWYQPILQSDSNGAYSIVGADTELRVRTNDGGYVMASEFTAELDDQKLSQELNQRFIKSTIQALNRWAVASIIDKNFQVKMLVTEMSVKDEQLPDLIRKELSDAEISPSQIILEVPSGTRNLDRGAILELKNIGVSWAVCSECAELNIMTQLPECRPDFVLIGQNRWNSVVLPHLIDVCHELSIHPYAQNIDNRELLTKLQNLGVRYYQGNLFEERVRAVDFISNWGRSKITGLSHHMGSRVTLGLAM
ncbi:MAG: diguanylate cyclase [Granulosicoccus sp.]|nr:diguanylate cyclase [Granulosicoccus sp.]